MVFNRQPTIRPPLHSGSINTLAALRPGVVISGSSDKVGDYYINYDLILDDNCSQHGHRRMCA
jgi:hypothetical protein